MSSDRLQENLQRWQQLAANAPKRRPIPTFQGFEDGELLVSIDDSEPQAYGRLMGKGTPAIGAQLPEFIGPGGPLLRGVDRRPDPRRRRAIRLASLNNFWLWDNYGGAITELQDEPLIFKIQYSSLPLSIREGSYQETVTFEEDNPEGYPAGDYTYTLSSIYADAFILSQPVLASPYTLTSTAIVDFVAQRPGRIGAAIDVRQLQAGQTETVYSSLEQMRDQRILEAGAADPGGITRRQTYTQPNFDINDFIGNISIFQGFSEFAPNYYRGNPVGSTNTFTSSIDLSPGQQFLLASFAYVSSTYISSFDLYPAGFTPPATGDSFVGYYVSYSPDDLFDHIEAEITLELTPTPPP